MHWWVTQELAAAQRAIMMLPALASFSAAAAAVGLSLQLDPWCDHSIRVRMRPGAGAAQPSTSEPATVYTSVARGDSVVCISTACAHSEVASGYTRGAVLGYTAGPVVPQNDTVELAVYYNHHTLDNLVGPAHQLPSYGGRTKGYSQVFANGALLKRAASVAPAPTKALVLYFNDQTHHSLATSSTPPAGYSQLTVLGHLCLTKGCGGTAPRPAPAPAAPLPILSWLPGALRRDCMAGGGAASPPPPPLRGAGHLQNGNLKAEVVVGGPGGVPLIRFSVRASSDSSMGR